MSWIDSLRGWALNVSTLHFSIITAIITGLAIAGLVYAFVLLRRAHVIEGTPTSKIRSAAQGYVELHGVGQLMEGAPIISPLTGLQCTWYRYKVEKMGDKHSRIVESGVSDEMFLLVGETGRCVVDPEGAVVTPRTKQVWYEHSYPSRKRSLQGSSNLLNSMVRGRYRYTEERMHHGETLYAIGMFMSVGGHNDTFNTDEEVRALLKEWKSDKKTMLEKFDANGDGEIDVHEWEAVRKAAYRQVKKDQVERSVKPPTHVMVKPKHDNRPYLLSVLPQRELVKRFKLKALASAVGFLVLGSASAIMLTARLV